MTLPAAPPRRSRPPVVTAARLAVVLLTLAAVVAGCSTINLFNDFNGELRDAGLREPTVNLEPGSTTATLLVVAKSPADTSTEEGQALAAKVVWEQFPRRFERLNIRIDGERESFTYDQLKERHGPRDASLDATDLQAELNRTALSVMVGLLIMGLLFVLLTVIVAVMVIRKRRRQPAAQPVAWPAHPDPASQLPVPPAGGWASPVGEAQDGAPSGDGHSPPDDEPSASDTAPVSASATAEPPAAGYPQPQYPFPNRPPGWVRPAPPGFTAEPRPPQTKEDRKLNGRFPPGLVPDKAHTPPGWD